MRNRLFITGLLVFVLAWGMMVVGCDNGTTDGDSNGNNNDDDNGEELPKSSGVNELSGKTFYSWMGSVVFSVTANDAANGTYTVGTTALSGGKGYIDVETGTYSWNEGAKTVTLKPEKVDSSTGGYYSGVLVNKAEDRKIMGAFIESLKEEMGDALFKQKYFIEDGYSNMTEMIDIAVNSRFDNHIRGYSLSTDGMALFLERPLPENIGINELSGQTYHYGDDEDIDYEDIYGYRDVIFTASGYTDISITGSYAYNSNTKRVWMQPELINGKNRATVYATEFGDDDSVSRASQTNNLFEGVHHNYSSTNKTISFIRSSNVTRLY